ncbi:MAG: hypothetical protein JXC85_03330 [Candidatus Aenigmarchaeota archaeon]|nr:hypothetical protein [Candidatus Aenigmarchaeota archaeon]
MMRGVIKAIQVLAVFCAYLIMSIPVISASQVSIFMPGGQTVVFSMEPSEKVLRNVTIVHEPSDHQWENVQIKIEIVGRDPSYSVKKIYLFKCRNSSPTSCSNLEPVEAKNYLSGQKGTFFWNDVSEKTIAGFMSFVQLEHAGKTIWVGFWDEVERVEMKSFVHTSYEVDTITAYMKPGAEAEWIKNYMEKYYMIPMTLVERATLGVVDTKLTSKMYKLSADAADLEVPEFDTQTDQGNDVSSLGKDFMFVFGKGSTASAFTFYSGTPYTCGNGVCETSMGENEQTCCVDCQCPGSKECSVTVEFPNGACHQCGDGMIEPTEDSSSCCADAGCPAGYSCDTTRNKPGGTCALPDCGNALCDVPEEDAGNCCIDCGSDSACRIEFGPGYYCNSELISCIEPTCGNGVCEPGEDYSNCCADCGGCPSGEFCNVEIAEDGVCMPTTCGNGVCEPGEDYSNCCLDCDSCPLDPSNYEQQTCSLNKCHLCGNGVYEQPAESERTCCQDSGCSNEDEFCSLTGRCTTEGGIGFSVLVIPEDVDCTLEDPITLRISLENRPKYFDYFRSAYYDYAGYQRRMICQEIGDVYECEIPVRGPDSYPGCFDLGEQEINITINLYYFRDKLAEEEWDSSMATLRGAAMVNIDKARSRVCDRDGSCELEIGETAESCCWDCGCGGRLICTAAGCSGERSITMRVDESSLPTKQQVDCSTGAGRITFAADVLNVPYSADDLFQVVNWVLHYDGRNFTSGTLPGFSCEPEAGTGQMLTGRVVCEIPVSLFPACPYDPPADIGLDLYVLGGGLSQFYGSYSGKRLNDTFRLDYMQGVPNCGDGVIDDGETSLNCCLDAGCPAGRLCSLYSGCIDESQLDLSVSLSPSTFNCSDSSLDIVFSAAIDPKPISMLGFDHTYMNRTRIDHYCYPGLQSDYVLECSIPTVDLPYCWTNGLKTVTFDTSVLYKGVDETNRVDFSKPVRFNVIDVRKRECDMDGVCEYDIGEIPGQCCSDCGCNGGYLCNFENECVFQSDLTLTTDYEPEVDCSGESGYYFTFDAEIPNQPHGTTSVDWSIRLGAETYGSDIFTCGILDSENKYRCDISIYNLPLCHTQATKTMALMANISYVDALGYLNSVAVESGITLEPSNWLDSCTNPITGGNPSCQPALGETQTTCCQDCGCDSFGPNHVCTAGGCQPKSAVSLTLEPASIRTECTLLPEEADVDDEGGSVTKYLCQFRKPFEIEAHVDNMPVHTSDPIDLFYYFNGDKDGKVHDRIMSVEETTWGWRLKVQPNPLESSSRNIRTSQLIGIGFSLIAADQGNEIVIPLEGENDISLTYNVKESDHLVSIENRIKEYTEQMDKLAGYMEIIFFIFGFCTPCFGDQYMGYQIAMTDLFGSEIALAYLVAALIASALGYWAASETDFAAAYAWGLGAGLTLYFITCPSCGSVCPNITPLCLIVCIGAALAMLLIMNKMDDATMQAESDIQQDIALAKADVGDDLSFYYQGG